MNIRLSLICAFLLVTTACVHQPTSARLPASDKAEPVSCQGILKSVLIGYEVDQSKCSGQGVYTGEGCTETRYDVVAMSKEWGEQTEFDFFAIEKNKFAALAKAGKLTLSMTMYNRKGARMWSETLDKWVSWQVKGSNVVYMRLADFDAHATFNPPIDKVMNKYYSFKKAKRGEFDERLPKNIELRLSAGKQNKVLCTYSFFVQPPANH